MSAPPNSDGNPLAVASALMQAFNEQAWTRLRALYHDDSLLVSVAGGDEPLGPDESIAAMRRASKDIVHSITFGAPELIDEHAAVVPGSVRARQPDGRGFRVARRAWIVTFKDDRLYRLHVCRDVAAATRLYASRGVTLGL